MAENAGSATRVVVVGTGAIGSAVARRLLAAGRAVVVWNRTGGRHTELVRAGALPAGSVREAALSGELILLTLTDYAAVGQCLEQLDGDLTGRTIVAMCTGTASDARRSAERVAELGAHYLDAGIQTSPDAIDAAAGTILYGGSRRAYEQHRSTLALLGEPRFVGDTPEAAAVWDLALFGLWYDAQLGLLRALDTVREAGIDVAEFARTAGPQLGHVVTGVPGTVAELLRSSYPAGPADLAGHLGVVRHLIELRSDRGLGDGGLSIVAARMEALIADGRGGEGLTATIGYR
ncbi:NAD(P)-dependent oxidoreductase [Micromonospora sp. NPDC050397]|uniref:NAD(P)-dependent oxidoreductase n=1 Tax=Micromonospora sp. NPDC050397 TaxID=3364279 RepID=UPI00384C80C6